MPGQQECLCDHWAQGAFSASPPWALGFVRAERIGFVGRRPGCPGGAGPVRPSPDFPADGAGRTALARVRGGLNLAQEGEYPLAQLQISGFGKQMVPSAT